MNNNYENIIQNNKNIANNINNNSSKRKTLLIVIGTLLVISLVLLVGYKFFENKNSNINSIFDENNLIKIKKDKKYGYINSNGKIVIEPIYESASDFNGNYALVEIVENDDEIYQLIDQTGKVRVQSNYYSDIEYISEYDSWVINDQLYNGSLKKITSDDIEVDYADYDYLRWENEKERTAGIMNISGKITYTYKFKNDEDFFYVQPSDIDPTLKERYCIVSIEDEKDEIVNCDTGKVIFDFTENNIFDKDNNIFEVSERGSYETKMLMYIQNDKIFYQTSSDAIDLDYYPGYIRIKYSDKDYNNRFTYLDLKTGNISSAIPSNMDYDLDFDAWEDLTGITKTSCGQGLGLVLNEKEILPCEWNSIDYFSPSLYQYLLTKDKNYVMTTKDNKTVAEFNASYIYDDESTFIYYKDSSTKEIIVYNLITEKTMKVVSENMLNIYSNYLTIETDNKIDYYNTDLKLIYSEEK